MRSLWLALFLVLGGLACQRAYYEGAEKLGIHKREILASRLEDARESQVEAKEQFLSALDQFRQVVDVPPSELEARYETLRDELEASEAAADEVKTRITKVEDVADALFDEWSRELQDYDNKALRRRSRAKLTETKQRYGTVMRAMRSAEARLDPALEPFRDSVLYLKHNLNAEAVAALDDELSAIDREIEALVKNVEQSVQEADEFLAEYERS